jgi:hypothetical protein
VFVVTEPPVPVVTEPPVFVVTAPPVPVVTVPPVLVVSVPPVPPMPVTAPPVPVVTPPVLEPPSGVVEQDQLSRPAGSSQVEAKAKRWNGLRRIKASLLTCCSRARLGFRRFF